LKRERPSDADRGEIVPVGPLECALVAGASSGRIACASIFRIAESQGVPVAEAGRAVQRLRIKVTGCQTGCF
jgi:NADP-dependent 3-hydroxy acid dehydrogenase YdfG